MPPFDSQSTKIELDQTTRYWSVIFPKTKQRNDPKQKWGHFRYIPIINYVWYILAKKKKLRIIYMSKTGKNRIILQYACEKKILFVIHHARRIN